MITADKDWIPFMKDLDRLIEKCEPDQKRMLKKMRKFARKEGYITINMFAIINGMLLDLDEKEEKE